MNKILRRIEENLKIPQKNIHIYAFIDEYPRGWGCSFLKKAGVHDSVQQGFVLDSLACNGRELYNAGKLTIVMPNQWMPVIRMFNRNTDTHPSDLNSIAEEYLVHHGMITEYLPEKKKQVDWTVNSMDHFMHVVYYVDTSARKILPKSFDQRTYQLSSLNKALIRQVLLRGMAGSYYEHDETPYGDDIAGFIEMTNDTISADRIEEIADYYSLDRKNFLEVINDEKECADWLQKRAVPWENPW